jgi:hypothetical protein
MWKSTSLDDKEYRIFENFIILSEVKHSEEEDKQISYDAKKCKDMKLLEFNKSKSIHEIIEIWKWKVIRAWI